MYETRTINNVQRKGTKMRLLLIPVHIALNLLAYIGDCADSASAWISRKTDRNSDLPNAPITGPQEETHDDR